MSCSQPQGWRPSRPALNPAPLQPTYQSPLRCLKPQKRYSLHSVAVPKHDVVSEGAVNIQIYLLDFRGQALRLFFHLLEGRGAEEKKGSDLV